MTMLHRIAAAVHREMRCQDRPCDFLKGCTCAENAARAAVEAMLPPDGGGLHPLAGHLTKFERAFKAAYGPHGYYESLMAGLNAVFRAILTEQETNP